MRSKILGILKTEMGIYTFVTRVIVKKNFEKCWALQKTSDRFSAIPLDQAHEQENAKLKRKIY